MGRREINRLHSIDTSPSQKGESCLCSKDSCLDTMFLACFWDESKVTTVVRYSHDIAMRSVVEYIHMY